MTSAETLIRATANRLKIRLQKKIISSMSKTAVFVKDVPDAIKKEWSLFKDELNEEISRLEDLDNHKEVHSEANFNKESHPKDLKEKIGSMKVKIANLTSRIEELN